MLSLASQVGSELSGVIYILDEPSIGLHQRDNEKLLATLCRMRDIGNSVIVVERKISLLAQCAGNSHQETRKLTHKRGNL